MYLVELILMNCVALVSRAYIQYVLGGKILENLPNSLNFCLAKISCYTLLVCIGTNIPMFVCCCFHRKVSPSHEGIVHMVLPHTWIKNWAESLESESAGRSYDNHTPSNTSLGSINALESDNETNPKQDDSNKSQTDLSKSTRKTNEIEWSGNVFKPLTSRSHSFNDILSEGRVISSMPTKAPSIPLLKVTLDNESTMAASSLTAVSTERCDSMFESEEDLALGKKPNSRHSTYSDSQVVFEGELVLESRKPQTSMKRSSSDTLINITHQSGEESEPMRKLSHFTNRVKDNFLTPTKLSEPKATLPSSLKESNYDSDTSTSGRFRYQVSKKLLAVGQKLKDYSSGVSRLNAGLGWSRSPQQGELMTDETNKEKRKRSKSKIVIV